MKKSILNIKGVKEISKNEQKQIQGGAYACWQIVCGITQEQCDDLQGRINKTTGCCGFVPLTQYC